MKILIFSNSLWNILNFRSNRNLNAYKMSKQVCYLPVNTSLEKGDIIEICNKVFEYEK